MLGIAALCKREGAQEPGASPSVQTEEKARNWESYTRAHFPRQFKVINQILQDNVGGQEDREAAHCMPKSVDRPFDDRRWTALHWAAFGGHKGLHILKSEHYSDCPQYRFILELTCENFCTGSIKKLLSLGFDVNVRDSFGQTAAHTAARDGHASALFTLTLHGCDLGTVDLNGYTPLHVAAQHGHPEALQLLLRLRPELVDAKDRNGSTSLHWACAQKHTEAVLALLQSHADVGLIWHACILLLHIYTYKTLKLFFRSSNPTLTSVTITSYIYIFIYMYTYV